MMMCVIFVKIKEISEYMKDYKSIVKGIRLN
jgi:hypothetical protein